jgi:RimJ/RimL family protein N-acetyltransferase
MLREHRFSGGTIRKLWPAETDKFRDHLMRLDKESRHLRFTHSVSDAFIESYAARVSDRMSDMSAIVYGYFVDGAVRAAAELHKLGTTWGKHAEAAFSVEEPYQNEGLGTELMGRVIRAARNRGVEHLYISCLAENTKMQAIARKHEANLRYELGDVVGDIVPPAPSYISMFMEAVEDRVGLMTAVLDLQERFVRAA